MPPVNSHGQREREIVERNKGLIIEYKEGKVLLEQIFPKKDGEFIWTATDTIGLSFVVSDVPPNSLETVEITLIPYSAIKKIQFIEAYKS